MYYINNNNNDISIKKYTICPFYQFICPMILLKDFLSVITQYSFSNSRCVVKTVWLYLTVSAELETAMEATTRLDCTRFDKLQRTGITIHKVLKYMFV